MIYIATIVYDTAVVNVFDENLLVEADSLQEITEMVSDYLMAKNSNKYINKRRLLRLEEISALKHLSLTNLE